MHKRLEHMSSLQEVFQESGSGFGWHMFGFGPFFGHRDPWISKKTSARFSVRNEEKNSRYQPQVVLSCWISAREVVGLVGLGDFHDFRGTPFWESSVWGHPDSEMFGKKRGISCGKQHLDVMG